MGIVYNGTIGLEMALHKLPVIVAGITHYGDLGFTNDVLSKEKYNDILSKKLPKLTDEKIQLARAYGYFYFIKSFIPYNLAYAKGFLKQGWNIKSFGELKEGENKNIDLICNYIIFNGIYQDW